MTMREKLSKGYVKPKRKLGGTTQFLEIIMQSSKIQSNVWCFFFQIEALSSLKNACLPVIFFMDTKSTC